MHNSTYIQKENDDQASHRLNILYVEYRTFRLVEEGSCLRKALKMEVLSGAFAENVGCCQQGRYP